MMFPAISLLALAASVFADTVSFDPVYDNGGQSLNTVACSTGSNGLITKGFTTFGSLPHFPNIGGVPAITVFNSPSCGTCWSITFNNKTVNILGIDVSNTVNIAESTMNLLTNNQAEQVGVIDAAVKQVNVSLCGL